jgi:hypothetical protein
VNVGQGGSDETDSPTVKAGKTEQVTQHQLRKQSIKDSHPAKVGRAE